MNLVSLKVVNYSLVRNFSQREKGGEGGKLDSLKLIIQNLILSEIEILKIYFYSYAQIGAD